MAAAPEILQLTAYQQRLLDYLQQSMANLPADTSDAEAQAYADQLLQSVIDHDVARKTETLLEDLSLQQDELNILYGNHQQSEVDNQLDQIRKAL